VNTEKLNYRNRNHFIDENKFFIYNAAYSVCKRPLSWENDDELSIALIAFNTACDNYENLRGDFYSYAKVLIRNALIDYFRRSTKFDQVAFDYNDETVNYIDFKHSLHQYELQSENAMRAEEIKILSQELARYKLDFNTLTEASPSHSDTRKMLLNIAYMCSKNETILHYIKSKGKLPIKEIALYTTAKKKTIEKWRKYLLTLILILSSSEYPFIKSYLQLRVGENND
jgi:RNA polymerase sigma factor